MTGRVPDSGRTCRRRRFLAAIGLAASLVAVRAPAQIGPAPVRSTPLVGRVEQDFELHFARPLFMPTGVAVRDDGAVFVVDGVNDRLVQFDASGSPVTEIHDVGGETLDRPIAARFDRDGKLWIADTGNHRVLALDPDGSLASVFTPDAAALGRQPDITDVLPAADGTLWLVDNDHHVLLRGTPATGECETIGRQGQSLAEFHYPFMLAAGPGGETLVTDVLNGRVQLFDPAGVAAGSIGSYGPDLGQLYRPKGIAVDAQGNVWISDGTLSVVQAFSLDGRLIDVLRDERGAPLRFELPMGLAFDSAGSLYVVELLANRVRKVEIARDPRAPLPPITRRGALGGGPQARFCTICHFEWLRPLVDGQPTELADVPPNPPDRPAVSRTSVCLGCHDGSVGDSRRTVWVEHGHRIGMEPRPPVAVPDNLPLADGKIACRTCHSAHTNPQSGTTIETIFFIRTDGPPQQLCVSCHRAYTEGVDHGMHPLGPMPVPPPSPSGTGQVPGAQQPARPRPWADQVTCLSCHTGHGAKFESLLILNPDDNQLCLSCHVSVSPGLFGENIRSKHGRRPTLNATQATVADDFGTRRGPQGELLCLTCHSVHQAPVARNLLSFDPARRDVCAECHVDKQEVVGSGHDLRTNHPDATNIMGIPAAIGGACSGCHTAHQFARTPTPTELDPAGRCMTCHSAGGLAETCVLGPINHREAVCLDCHNPHQTRFGSFLKSSPTDACRTCHADHATVRNGPHALPVGATTRPAAPRAHPPATRPSGQRHIDSGAAWPEVSLAAHDTCLACHRPHGDEEHGLLRAGRAADVPGADAACLACHPSASPDAAGDIALIHPRVVTTTIEPGALPLGVNDDGQPLVACQTCHNPHAGADPAHLIRVPPATPSDRLCMTCHADRANVAQIGHAEELMAQIGFDSTGCQPCHITHGSHEFVEPRYLWPRSLTDYPGAADAPVADRYCFACHRADGPVAPPAIAGHPQADMYNPFEPDEAGYLPLYDADGEIAPDGTIACRTCHLTHGRISPAVLTVTSDHVSLRELRARVWHARSFGPASVCTTCHGVDALRRFIYFHDPARRGGPIELPAP